MTKEEHRERHIKLHKALDELMADFASHTRRGFTDTSVMELMQWSYKQTQDPDPDENRFDYGGELK